MVAVFGLTAGCQGHVGAVPGSGAADVATSGGAAAAGSLRENGVEVTLRWVPAGSGDPVLTARFTPSQPGFHLYSVDLPATGVDGVGRPTRLEVGGALTAVGPPTTDASVVALRIEGVADPLPVYPEGAVTVRQAVRVGASGRVEVFVSYAACSRTTCLPPTSRQWVDLSRPTAS